MHKVTHTNTVWHIAHNPRKLWCHRLGSGLLMLHLHIRGIWCHLQHITASFWYSSSACWCIRGDLVSICEMHQSPSACNKLEKDSVQSIPCISFCGEKKTRNIRTRHAISTYMYIGVRPPPCGGKATYLWSINLNGCILQYPLPNIPTDTPCACPSNNLQNMPLWEWFIYSCGDRQFRSAAVGKPVVFCNQVAKLPHVNFHAKRGIPVCDAT